MDSIDQSLEEEGLEDAIAIIGMACRFPGAVDVAAYWDLLKAGRCAIRHFSIDEALQDGADPREVEQPNHVRAFGVLEDAECFDGAYFGINPRDALAMDPQQRLFLEVATSALHDSGYDPQHSSHAIGVFAGATTSTYHLNALLRSPAWQTAEASEEALFGNFHGFLATRLSYLLNLRGPSIAVQSACSTSLVAVHLACQSLMNFECDMALAGGVSVQWPQKRGYLYEPDGIYAPDGVCRPFDHQAKGVVFGNGAGAVVLKRLADALADKDAIDAVILGSAVNNDGADKVGYTAPSVTGQAQVIKTAHRYSAVDPNDIGLVEAHGTGTALGDPIEVRALKDAFGTCSSQNQCALSSVKSNIGHLDAAAGIASLIKAALAVRHGVITGTAGFSAPNSELGLEGSPFQVSAETQPWPEHFSNRIATVSSFGFGGTNAHAVLRDWPVTENEHTDKDAYHIVPVSGMTQAAVTAQFQQLETFGKSADAQGSLAGFAHVMQSGRRTLPFRGAAVVKEISEIKADDAALRARERLKDDLAPVFLFSGQGAQYVEMGAALFEASPVFRNAFRTCSEGFAPLIGENLEDLVFGRSASAQTRLGETRFTQPALFTIEYALAKWWEDIGVVPRAMIGHSIGEYVCACLAGVFSLDDTLRAVAKRAALMQAADPGAMLAVTLPADQIAADLPPEVQLAAVNAPDLSAVAGPIAAIDDYEAMLAAKGVSVTRLRTSHAFHSAMMEDASAALETYLETLSLRAPQIPFVSTVTGQWMTDEDATSPAYWASQIRQPVQFSQAIVTLLQDMPAALIEVGPGHTLTTLAGLHITPQQPATAISTLPTAKDAGSDVAHCLGAAASFWCAGGVLDWPKLHSTPPRKRHLPGYPFARTPYAVKAHLEDTMGARLPVKEADLGNWTYAPSWTRSVAPLRSDGHALHQFILLDPGGPIGAALKADLIAQGHDVVTIDMSALERQQPGTIKNEIAQHVDETRPTQVIHLGFLMPAPDGSQQALLAHTQSIGLWPLLEACQALIENAAGAQSRVLVCGAGVHSIMAEPCPGAHMMTARGLLAALTAETQMSATFVDLPAAASETDAPGLAVAQILSEALCDDPVPCAAYRNGQRWLPTQCRAPLAAPSDSPKRLVQDGHYMITGGLGGLGLAFASFLARSVSARLTLITRRSPPYSADVATALEEIEAAGARVEIVQTDVSNAADMANAIDASMARFGKINGVFHLAGIAGGGLLEMQTRESLAETFAAKAKGAAVLQDVLRAHDVDFLMLNSSLAALFTTAGRGDYAAANLFLDALAQDPYATVGQTGRIVTVNWDLWTQTGMGADSSPALDGITTQEGVSILARVLNCDAAHIIVSCRDVEALRTLDLAVTHDGETVIDSAETTSSRPNTNSDYVAPVTPLETALCEAWSAVLGVSPIGIKDDFFELGGNSLLALRIASRVRKAQGVDIGPKAILQHLTIGALAAHLAPVDTQDRAAPTAAVEDLKAKVAEMSIEEVKAMLAAKRGKAQPASVTKKP